MAYQDSNGNVVLEFPEFTDLQDKAASVDALEAELDALKEATKEPSDRAYRLTAVQLAISAIPAVGVSTNDVVALSRSIYGFIMEEPAAPKNVVSFSRGSSTI